MRRTLVIAVRLSLLTLVVTGVVYPLLVTAAAQLLFPRQAHGSLVTDDDGTVVGAAPIGQRFTAPGYLHGRPSAAGAQGYDAMASSGSNLGPSSLALRERMTAEHTRLRALNPQQPLAVPVELVSASASGLDPHLSPEAARWQAPRIAAARGVTLARVLAVIDANVESPDLGLLGEPRVNVLRTNLALDRTFDGHGVGSVLAR
ncbi:MAG: potassium-transporting ATPase subunit KdpC [Nannocystaceae bacterium]|nr:potassium-transporting ATPase subunit KdpC [Nannocystaceae bacterium]